MEDIGIPIQGQVSPQALERFQRPRNYGPLSEFDGHARITGPCGDTMEFWLQIADRRIVRGGFTTDGCGPSRAAGSMATELAVGKRPGEAALIAQGDILAALGGLPKESEHCALLASNTLRAAAQDLLSHLKKDRAGQCGQCSETECPSKQRQPEESEHEFLDRQALAQKMCQGETLAREMNVPFLGRIPIDPEIVRCGDSGTPYTRRSAQNPAAQAFADIVQRIQHTLTSCPSSLKPSRSEKPS